MKIVSELSPEQVIENLKKNTSQLSLSLFWKYQLPIIGEFKGPKIRLFQQDFTGQNQFSKYLFFMGEIEKTAKGCQIIGEFRQKLFTKLLLTVWLVFSGFMSVLSLCILSFTAFIFLSDHRWDVKDRQIFGFFVVYGFMAAGFFWYSYSTRRLIRGMGENPLPLITELLVTCSQGERSDQRNSSDVTSIS